jgi:phage/plasmid-associated DNA primase
MVEGCRYWQERGLDPPPQVLPYQAREAAQPKQPVEAFVAKCVVRRPGARVPATALYLAFTAWCSARGYAPIAQRDFGTYLGREGFGSKKSNGVITYLDIALKSDGEDRG